MSLTLLKIINNFCLSIVHIYALIYFIGKSLYSNGTNWANRTKRGKNEAKWGQWRWRFRWDFQWRWQFHCDYIANSAQLHWDLGWAWQLFKIDLQVCLRYFKTPGSVLSLGVDFVLPLSQQEQEQQQEEPLTKIYQ